MKTRLPATSSATTPTSATGAVLLFNKPYGVLCQFTGDGSRPTLAEYIRVPDFYAAGRLDADSEGLVVLTADGRLQARIADPRHRLSKTYWAQVEGTPRPEQLSALAAGVTLSDGLTRPAVARVLETPPPVPPRDPPIRHRLSVPTAWLELILAEGRNRQVRRMTAAVGLPTLRLLRTAVGPFTLEGIESGRWRRIEGARAML